MLETTIAPGASKTTVLHYIGYNDDRGGTVSVIRTLADAGQFTCVLGVNHGFAQRRTPLLATLELPTIESERISLSTFWRARVVAREARSWLQAAPNRVFHGHSRAGLLVALWLRWLGESSVVASVHCLGRQRWFYRWAASVLGPRLYWLGPAMKRHYRLSDTSWTGCVPDCVALPKWSALQKKTRTDEVVRFGCVGSLVPVKQWELVLHALAKVPPTARLRVVHAGGENGTPASARYAGELYRMTAGLGLGSRLEWRGEIGDMAAFYSEIDCLVVASRWEASSMAALEAATARVPVLAADAAGTRDLVERAGLGWLFHADDAADLAREMLRLVEGDALQHVRIDPELLRPFTASVVAEQWRQIYARALARE